MKSSKMQLRWVGGGLAAVLVAGLLGHAPQAQATVLIYDTFDNYGATAQNGATLDQSAATNASSIYGTYFDALDTNNAAIRYVFNPGGLVTNGVTNANSNNIAGSNFGPVLPGSSLQQPAGNTTNGYYYGTNGQWATRATASIVTDYSASAPIAAAGSTPKWFSLLTGNSITALAPAMTLGYSVRTTNGTTNTFNYDRAQSPFAIPTANGYTAASSNGYGLALVDQTANVGQVRRVQSQFNASTNFTTIGTTNYQVTHVGADMRLFQNNMSFAGANSNSNVANIDNNSMTYGLRLFDAAQNQTKIGIGSGFYMLLSENVDSGTNSNESTNLASIKIYNSNLAFPAGTANSYTNTGNFTTLFVSTDDTGSSGSMATASIDMTRWYHFDIDLFVSNGDNSDYATASVKYYTDDTLTATITKTLYYLDTVNSIYTTHLPFSLNTVGTNTINAVEWGMFNNAAIYSGIGALDNLSITDGQPLPEPATLGLLALGTTLMLRRGKRA